MKKILCFALLMAIALANAYAAGGIVVKGAWVMAMPPVQKVTAGYMTIINKSSSSIVLVSAASNISAATEIHQMKHENGMMRMSKVSKVSIAPGGQLKLEPKGYHLMLIGLLNPVKKGDTVIITLRFLNGQNVEVKARVR